jgi:serine/threonine-protein kinase
LVDAAVTVPAGIPAAGEVIAGKYCVERVLGVGGMGVVLAAKHLRLEEEVAIKILLPDLAKNSEVVERFMREARASVRIKNDHVGRVFDVETLPNGTPYMVMECLQGTDLKELITASGPLAPMQAVDYVLQACEALAEAHALGIIHRDLKPSNLYLANRPDGTSRIKVLDFGIAKLADGVETGMTKTNVQMGTPSYMAPEQLRSVRDIDPRVDVWALGVVLYELLTGTLPFEGDTLASIAVAVCLNPAPLLRTIRSDVPAGLEEVVRRCLEKERDGRYPSIVTFAEALAPLASAEGVASSQRIVRAGNRQVSSPSLADHMPGSNPAIRAAAPSTPEMVAIANAIAPAIAPMAKTDGPWQKGQHGTGASQPRSRFWLLIAAAGVVTGAVGIALVLRSTDRTASGAAARVEAPVNAEAIDAGAAPIASAAPIPTTIASEESLAPPSTSSTPVRKNRSHASASPAVKPASSARPSKRDSLPDIH